MNLQTITSTRLASAIAISARSSPSASHPRHLRSPGRQRLPIKQEGFIGSVKRPAAQQRIKQLMELGLQASPDVEKRLPDYTGTLGNPTK